MIKHLAVCFLCLLSVGSTANPFVDKDQLHVAGFFKGAVSPCLWVLTQHPISPYYGADYVRTLVKNSGCDRMVVSYIEPDPSNSKTAIRQKVEKIHEAITIASPMMYLITEEDLWNYLVNFVPPRAIQAARMDTLYVLPESAPEVIGSLGVERVKGLSTAFVLEEFQLTARPIYILNDRSRKSKHITDTIRTELRNVGLKATVFTSTTISDLRNTLQQLNGKPKGVIINATYVLQDKEALSYRYIDYITAMILKVNVKHIDIGFFKSLYNESIVIDLDILPLAKAIAQASVDDLGEIESIDLTDVRLRPKIFIRPDRLLKLDVPYVNAFDTIDGVLNK